MESPYLNSLALFGIGGAHPGGLSLTKKLLSREEINRNTKILDIGCGTGQTSAYLVKKYGCHVTALELNQIMLEKAKERFELSGLSIGLRYGSVENLPFDDGSFDFVLSESVIAFTEIPLTIPELRRVLAPNGRLLAIEMVRKKPVSKEEHKQILDFYGVKHLLTDQEWVSLFKKAGFKKIQTEKFSLRPNEQEVHDAADFSPSSQIDPSHYEVMEKHHDLSEVYKHILGCCIFHCQA